jgi:endonuclease/exonuclease/phosphatase family metal-dependent hydrolase
LHGASRWSLLPLAITALGLAGLLAPQRAGPVALLAVVAPYAFGLVLLLLTPLAVLRRDVFLAASLGLAAAVGALAYPPLATAPHAGGSPELTILTWNLHGEEAEAVGLRSVLERARPDVVMLQEAGADAERLVAEGMSVIHHADAATPPGMVLASRLRVRDSGEVGGEAGIWDRHRAFWLEVEAPGGPLTLIGAHLSFPVPLDSLPCPYCPERRDRQVAALVRAATELAGSGGRVVLAGDFNLSEREAAYRDIAASLTDAARGLSWRPVAVRWLPPVLRLDYVFIGAGLASVGSETACELSGSDHCPVWVRLRSR